MVLQNELVLRAANNDGQIAGRWGNESEGEQILITGVTEKLEKSKNERTRRKYEDRRKWM